MQAKQLTAVLSDIRRHPPRHPLKRGAGSAVLSRSPYFGTSRKVKMDSGILSNSFVVKVKKNPPKSQDFDGFWSEWGDSNSRHLAPKCVSEPSADTLPSSLALSSAWAVPL